MFEKALEYIGLQYTRFIFRKEKDTQQVMTNFIERSRRALIILPTEYDDAFTAGTTFKALKEKFDHLQITILTEGIRATPLNEFQKSKIIRMRSSHINKLFLPRQNFLRTILENKYDIVIDLNLDFVLYTAYISKASGANIRIGFAHKYTDYFYNIQFNVDRNRPAQEIYNQLVQYLKKF